MSRTLQVSSHRPGCYPTIADALGEVSGSCRLILDAGRYEESLRLNRLDLTIEAADHGADEVIEIVSPTYEPAILSVDSTLKISGVTVLGGEGDAIKATGGSLTIDKCIISSRLGPALRLSDQLTFTVDEVQIGPANQGIVIEDASGVLDRVVIRSTADDAIVVRLGADPQIRNCTIEDAGNRGIYIYESAKPTIEGCEIVRSREAGVLVASGGAPSLIRCHIHDVAGSGVVFSSDTSGSIVNCTVERTGNPAVDIADGARVEVTEGKAGSAGVTGERTADSDPQRIEELLAELDQMVGLEAVKAEVRSIIDEIQVNEWRRSAGLSVDGTSSHLIFAGAPGTGKTTVGRIYGQLLAALGVLPGGPLREVSRRDLVGQYIGHTAEKTAAVFDEAKGGVVFLDEAYTLTRQAGGGGNDFGQEAVDMIVKLMEDMRKEIAVIAAGYTNEMRDFLDANPGLASRFVKTIEFENYSPEDLTLIIGRMMDAGDYQLGEGCHARLLQHFALIPRDESFGNARDARKLFEALRKVQSQRLRTLEGQPTRDQLLTINLDDVKKLTLGDPPDA